MKKYAKYIVTGAILLAAVTVTLAYFWNYVENPWTRDAQVRADIVGVASRVSGPMIRLYVKDNDRVSRGDLLFEIDPTMYAIAVEKAEAELARVRQTLALKEKELARRRDLVDREFISRETYEIYQTECAEAAAEVRVAESHLHDAREKLNYTQVFAYVDGYVTGLEIAQGTYVTAGQPLFALIDVNSFWVAAYFKETRLRHIDVGDRAQVCFMGNRFRVWHGTVESVSYGIRRKDGALVDLLPQIKPTMDWVRLAQRFPVRIRLDEGELLSPFRKGETATVIVFKNSAEGGR